MEGLGVPNPGAGGGWWAHASPGRNLRAVLRNGLLPNAGGGNYAGYEAACDGVYLTGNPHIVASHIAAPDMDNDFLLAFAELPAGAAVLPDEDAIHSWIEVAARDVLSPLGLGLRDAADGAFGPDHPAWAALPAALAARLGPPDAGFEAAARAAHLAEYADAWVRHDVFAEDIDPTWWPGAKDLLVRMFPRIGHPAWGEDFRSVRVPGPVPWEGPGPRLAAVVRVLDGRPVVERGGLSPAEAELVAWLSAAGADPPRTEPAVPAR